MIRLRLLLGLLFCLSLLPGVIAIGIDLDDSDTFADVLVTSASNLYAYEVNLDYTGTVSVPSIGNNFFASSTSFGSSTRNGILSVYESKLDSTQTGVSGSGSLFNVTHTGTLTKRYALFVYADGTEEYVYYNNSVSGGSDSNGGSSSSSGSSGGISGNVSLVETIDPDEIILSAKPEELSFSVIVDEQSIRTFNVTNTGTASATVTLRVKNLEGYISVPQSLTFRPGEEKIVVVEIEPIDRGLLTGIIEFSFLNTSLLEVPVVLNVRSEDFLFDTLLSLSDADRRLYAGDKLTAQIDLEQVGQNDKIDVVANYYLKDYSGEIYSQESETFFVLNEKSYSKSFSTDTLLPGKYFLGIEIIYPGAFATSSVQFEIIEPFAFENYPGIVITILAAALAVTLLLVVSFTMIRKPTRFRSRR